LEYIKGRLFKKMGKMRPPLVFSCVFTKGKNGVKQTLKRGGQKSKRRERKTRNSEENEKKRDEEQIDA